MLFTVFILYETIQMYKEMCFFKESVHLLAAVLEPTCLHSRVIFLICGFICHTWAESESERKYIANQLYNNLIYSLFSLTTYTWFSVTFPYQLHFVLCVLPICFDLIHQGQKMKGGSPNIRGDVPPQNTPSCTHAFWHIVFCVCLIKPATPCSSPYVLPLQESGGGAEKRWERRLSSPHC